MNKNICMIPSPAGIRRIIAGLRQKRKRVVFTNGVFDILHFGHIDYLTRAKALGDILIVGLNSDSSVRKFKSKDRPIQNEKDRAEILASLKPVDYVILFSEETPELLIKLVKPDILVKGADYKISEIVGADYVKSYGGLVRRVKLAKGRSTSDILDRIRKSRA